MRRTWLFTGLFLATLTALPVRAQDWVAIETPRFTIVSQLSERDTLRFTREFNQFVNALGTLLPANDSLLTPLHAVLFRRDGGFSPYRIRTESGVATNNAGAFINSFTWSILGMPGVRGASADNSTIYHEAIHWYMSADPTRYPLWFSEGMAEVLSTFDIEGGKAVWGRIPANTIGFLEATGLRPMEELLTISQDRAMHASATFYSQAWLFVHYLLIGRALDGGPAMLIGFLENLRTMSEEEAFLASFGMSFDEMESTLNLYSKRQELDTLITEIPESTATDFSVGPAQAELVELSLARLAFGTGNYDLMQEHLSRLLEIAPESAEAYDLMAVRRLQQGDDNIEPLLDDAIARGSRDARTYELKAVLRAEVLRRGSPLFSATAFEAADARRIANHLVSSANLRPVNLRVYEALADTYFSVVEFHDYDRDVLADGATLYPEEGIILIAQAAIAAADDELDEAVELIDLALTEGFNLTPREAVAARSLRSRLASRAGG